MMIFRSERRKARHRRIRSQVRGTSDCPRISVHRSAYRVYVQLINDETGETLITVCDNDVSSSKKKVDRSFLVGKEIAKRAVDQGIKRAVFDRGGYDFHGRVKAVADGARDGGLSL